MTLQNRRKWCALNRPAAHNSGSVVRVGTLGNKAAHYGSDLVRTAWIAVRALTSICGKATRRICRDRSRSAIAAPPGVRKLGRCCALSDFRIGRSAQPMRNAAHEDVGLKHVARSEARQRCGGCGVAGGASNVHLGVAR